MGIGNRTEMGVLVFFDRRLELFERLEVRFSGGMARICARGRGRRGRLVLIFGGVGRGTVIAAGGEGGAAPGKGASGASGRHGGREGVGETASGGG